MNIEEDAIESEEEDFELSIPYRDVIIRKDIQPDTEYDILKEELGRGTYGTVYLCQEKKTGHKFAAKFVTCNRKEDRRKLELEVDIMRELHHPKVIQFYNAFDDGKKICIILELILGGELFERIIDDKFVLTEQHCASFMSQICNGMNYVHSKNIIHLDLKPENILCVSRSGTRIKIIDFGMARKYDPKRKQQVLFGTPEFTAPEVVNFDEISFYTDMWSLGVICYLLLSGYSPFVGDTDLKTMSNVTIGSYDFNNEGFNNISEEAKDFIRHLLLVNGRKRMSIRQALHHIWLKKTIKKKNTELSATKLKLKCYVIRTRWVKALNTIIALQRMGAKIDCTLI